MCKDSLDVCSNSLKTVIGKGIHRYQRGRQKEIVKSEDRQDHGQQNATKDKHRTHNTTLKTKAGVKRTTKTRVSSGAPEG